MRIINYNAPYNPENLGDFPEIVLFKDEILPLTDKDGKHLDIKLEEDNFFRLSPSTLEVTRYEGKLEKEVNVREIRFEQLPTWVKDYLQSWGLKIIRTREKTIKELIHLHRIKGYEIVKDFVIFDPENPEYSDINAVYKVCDFNDKLTYFAKTKYGKFIPLKDHTLFKQGKDRFASSASGSDFKSLTEEERKGYLRCLDYSRIKYIYAIAKRDVETLCKMYKARKVEIRTIPLHGIEVEQISIFDYNGKEHRFLNQRYVEDNVEKELFVPFPDEVKTVTWKSLSEEQKKEHIKHSVLTLKLPPKLTALDKEKK